MSNPKIPNKLYTKEKIQQIKKALQDYIKSTELPIVAEFAYKNGIPRQTLYEIKEIKSLMEILIAKKEANLEKGGLSGQLDSSMTKFSLMQLGWKMRQQTENANLNIDSEITEREKKEYKEQLQAMFPDLKIKEK